MTDEWTQFHTCVWECVYVCFTYMCTHACQWGCIYRSMHSLRTVASVTCPPVFLFTLFFETWSFIEPVAHQSAVMVDQWIFASRLSRPPLCLPSPQSQLCIFAWCSASLVKYFSMRVGYLSLFIWMTNIFFSIF